MCNQLNKLNIPMESTPLEYLVYSQLVSIILVDILPHFRIIIWVKTNFM